MPKGYDEDYDGIPDAEENPGGGDPVIEALREIRNIFRREEVKELLGEDEEMGMEPPDGEMPMEDDEEEGMMAPRARPKSLSILIAAKKGKK